MPELPFPAPPGCPDGLTRGGRIVSLNSWALAGLAPIFRDNEILLTGANGFLGKVILAMLLDRYPAAARVSVLVRDRPDMSAGERFQREVLDSPPLRSLIEKQGREQVASRVNVLSGDTSEPLAGLREDQVQELSGRVRLIINCAGLVEFFPPADLSLRANVTAVERMLDLCRHLDAKLVHVSTCYVAGEADGLIEETEPIEGFFPRRSGPDDRSFQADREFRDSWAAAASVADGLEGAERREALTELGRVRAARWGWVNTYTYAKSLGEQILAAQRDIPYSIVRPAIVESAIRYPFPGWVEGGRTAAPLVLMAMGGLLDWPARPDLSLEVVPVDLIAAATLAVSGKLLAGETRNVYQLASSDRNPYPLQDLISLLCREARSNGNRPSGLPLWLDPIPRVRILDARGADQRRRTLRHRITWARRVLERTGRHNALSRLRILELQLQFHEETFRQYTPFTLDNRYVFESVNIRDLYADLAPVDREALPWDPASIDWPQYWRQCQIPGIRKWVQPEVVREWNFRI